MEKKKGKDGQCLTKSLNSFFQILIKINSVIHLFFQLFNQTDPNIRYAKNQSHEIHPSKLWTEVKLGFSCARKAIE